MDIAFDHSEDWNPLTIVRMARSRGRDDFRRYDDSGIIINRPIYGRNQFSPKRRPPRWKTLIIVLIIFIIVLYSGSTLYSRLQKYTPFTHTAEVAELTILKTREGQHQLSIWLTLVDANGYYKRDNKPRFIQGDKVILQYEYTIVPAWLEVSGLHSGYILINLEGIYNNGSIGSSLQLNVADNDNSIPTKVVSLLITRKYSSITLKPSRSIYKICITPTGQLKEC